MSLRIFIGFDSREAECSDILAYSLRAHSSIPLDIRYLDLRQLDFNRTRDPLQSTEFTYTRFLVPHLCGYQGKAIFMDCDMLCLGDIAELDDLDMTRLTRCAWSSTTTGRRRRPRWTARRRRSTRARTGRA